MEHLIIRWLQGRADEFEKRRLRRWRRESPEHEQEFRRVERLWQVAGSAEPITPSAPPPSAEALLARTPLPRRHRRLQPYWGRYMRWVAAVAALIVVGFAIAQLDFGESPESVDVAEFATSATDMVTVTLSDGSFVQLAPSSRLRFANGGAERTVWLDGQAFFGVAHKEGVPFVVRTPFGVASVLGTRFDLRVRQDELRLVVAEGTVRVASGDSSVDVRRGELSRARRGIAPTVDSVADIYPYLNWLQGTFVFHSTPLDQAMEEISRRFDRPVELTAPDLAERTITAWFTDASFVEIVTAICRVVEARCSVDDTAATIGL